MICGLQIVCLFMHAKQATVTLVDTIDADTSRYYHGVSLLPSLLPRA